MKFLEIEKRHLLSWREVTRDLRVLAMRDLVSVEDLRRTRAELLAVVGEDAKWLPLPSLIVTPAGAAARDLVAWANTYLPLRPLSSFCRVMTRDELWMLEKWPLDGIATCTDVSLLGPIFADAMIWGMGATLRRGLTADALMNTFSYVLARATMFGVLEEVSPLLRDRWATTHGARGRDVGLRDVAGVWKLISETLQPKQASLFDAPVENYLRAAIQHVADRTPIPRGLWTRLTTVDLDVDARRTAEDRLRTFVEAANRIRENRIPEDVQSFALAYLANSIAPGSFSHLNVLRQANVNAAAVSWYGFIAAADPSSRILSLGEGLAWRVYRELTLQDRLIDVTRADIGYVEYETLREHTVMRDALLRSAGARVCVELVPGIYSYIKDDVGSEDSLAPPRSPLQEIGVSLARALEAYRALSRDEGSQPKVRERRKKSS